ncbi:MAG: molybdenum cofactor guanylyltransferase MobA [Alphaproteobacteria bacterium]|nr:molybdenum cofactor guanylyltransferase MobA [Alphaproteobacteria bacterium]
MPADSGASRRVAGVLLAGGQSRRMGGGDKCQRPLGGRTILDWVIDRARPQVEALAINANGDPGRFAGFGLPVVADSIPDFAGPLAGILAGLDWAAANPAIDHLASFATDAPFLPLDLVVRLVKGVAETGADLACAKSDGQAHPVFGLWPVRLRTELRHALSVEGIRKVDQWTARYRLVQVPYSVVPQDPFFNANRPEDLAEAERIAQRIGR